MSDVRDLIFELGTEELPPKQLARLATALSEQMQAGLEKANLSFDSVQWFATPRRLAVAIVALQVEQKSKEETRRGPAVAAAFDKEGNPTPAAEGFARSCNTDVSQLQTLETDKGKWLSITVQAEAKQCKDILEDIINTACQKLPIAKRMRWGDKSFEFVRPVHWSLLVFGEELVEINLFGTKSSNISFGHRFHAPDAITINHASEYKQSLLDQGKVMVDFEERKNHIKNAVDQLAKENKASAIIDSSLLDEVTSINEWPVAIMGSFDKSYLELPREVLIASMQEHQKYFPVVNKEGKLLAHFITVANLESSNVDSVRAGNERVLGPRLSDARFFWQQDLKQKLEDYRAGLDDVLYQKQLGSLGDRTRRIGSLVNDIASELGVDTSLTNRAAELCKCDLLSDMVGEFPELQGVIGRYYAIENGEDSEVAEAINEQYMPRFAGDKVPDSAVGQILSLAEKLDTLLGIFSIGQIPTGDKDPFALRRNALGALRILIECELNLDLKQILKTACSAFKHEFDHTETVQQLFTFMMDRLRAYYHDKGIDAHAFESVLAKKTASPFEFAQRLNAVMAFQELPEAADLAAANKRIRNILKKNTTNSLAEVDSSLLQEAAEKNLASEVEKAKNAVEPLIASNQYFDTLKTLSTLRDPIDCFFEEVMVMAEDELIRNNRLSLLQSVSQLFLEIADISKLQDSK